MEDWVQVCNKFIVELQRDTFISTLDFVLFSKLTLAELPLFNCLWYLLELQQDIVFLLHGQLPGPGLLHQEQSYKAIQGGSWHCQKVTWKRLASGGSWRGELLSFWWPERSANSQNTSCSGLRSPSKFFGCLLAMFACLFLPNDQENNTAEAVSKPAVQGEGEINGVFTNLTKPIIRWCVCYTNKTFG